MASFAATIMVGTLLLLLPAATNLEATAGKSCGFIDALFTATSAVCVTGLIVQDTATYFSFFGQTVILFLIQIGGLGILTFSTLAVLLVGGRLALRGRMLLRETHYGIGRKDMKAVALRIVLYTLVIEGAGASILWARFAWEGRFNSWSGLFHGLFHSIAAFCNAGFSTFSANLLEYQSDVVVNLTIMLLIILGGIGFPVLVEIEDHLRRNKKIIFHRLSLHAKITLRVTGILLGIGLLLFLLLEWDNELSGKHFLTKVMSAAFLSVTPRTAGFNTVNIGALSNSTLLIIIILMFIGASPGSTGGGIKTTTLGIFLGLVQSRFQGKEHVSLYYRTVPKDVVDRTIAIAIASAIIVVAATVLLCITELGTASDLSSRGKTLQLFFEATSAFGTVGLSTGITPDLSSVGKLLVIAVMFIGRVGPLAIAVIIARRRPGPEYTHPEEAVAVG